MRIAAIAFLGGILVVQQCAALPSLFWALLLIPAAWLAWRDPRWLVLAFFIGGVAWTCWRADLVLQEKLSPTLEGRDLIVEGFVAGLPRPTEYGSRFRFDVTAAYLDGDAVPVPRHLRLSAGRDAHLRAGEAWRLAVRLKRPHGLQNPGGFDYEGYLFRAGLRATGYVRAAPAPQRLPQHTRRYAIHRLRQWLGERMRSLMPDNAYAGLIVALANGDRGGVTDAQWETLRRTGTLHLVAISGLHISLIAGVFYWLLRALWSLPGITVLRLPAQFAGAIGGLMAAGIYAALAGFVVPTQRALIMLGVAMGAVLLRRRIAASQLLAVALLLVLVFDPFAVMAPGFWLSYAAVAVIVYVVHGARGGALWRRVGYLQLAIALGMLPLTLWLFQRVSLVAPIANALAVPTFDLLVVPSTLFGALCAGSGFDYIAAAVFHADAVLLGWLWVALSFLASLDFAQWVQHQPPLWTLVCGLVGVAVLLAPRGWPARGVGIVWLLPMFLVRPAVPAAGEVRFTLLDVGQGLAAVVRTHAHTLVFDAGPRWSPRSDAGLSVVVPYLRANGVEHVDTLVVSHADNDHAGGVASVERLLPVARVLSGAAGISGEACRAGQHWRWDDVEFAVLNPAGGGATSRNNGSCVVRVRSAYGTVLLPADIEAEAERRLLARPTGTLRADILVAPHHGSRTSSTAEFIDAVHARYVVFPIGYRNRYHHPHPAVVARYRARGSRLYDSAASGAIEFRLGAGGIHASAYRERHHRYWYTSVAPP